MPGKMAYGGYTSDDGNVYAVKLRKRYADAAYLGFVAATGATPLLPRGVQMRGIYVQDPTGGATRFIPVGQVTADAWTGVAGTIPIDYSGIGTTTDAAIIGKRAETPAKVPHTIFNRSDAA